MIDLIIKRGLRFKSRLCLAFMLTVSLLSAYGQTPCTTPPPVPFGEDEQFFCSQSSWTNAGFTEPGDIILDLEIVGEDLTWYDDNAGVPGSVIPASTTLVDGATYYVTQTINGCESTPLAVEVTDKVCGCIKDRLIDYQDPEFSARGYTFYRQPISEHKTCGQLITASTPTFTRGGVDTNSEAQVVTSGFDPNIPGLPRTNPDNPFSTYGLALNRELSGSSPSSANVITMSKEFVAGEVFVFNFALVLQNPSGHDYEEQPFFQVRLYDDQGNQIQSQCLVSRPDDCIFNQNGSGTTLILFSDWSCMKMNTIAYQGQKIRAEFSIADCTLTGHYGYAYIDDLYVGDNSADICDDSSFGFVTVDSIDPETGSGQNDCYIPQQQAIQGGCTSGIAASSPLPMEVCGSFDTPNSTGAPADYDPNTDFTLDILQNGNVIGTVSGPTIDYANNTFCFTITASDFTVSPFGDFDLSTQIDYSLNCGSQYGFLVDDRSSIQVCPTAACPASLVSCDINGNGFGDFDLSSAETEMLDDYDASEIIFTYYTNENSAHLENGADEITNITSYQNSTAYDDSVYVRVDWTDPQYASCYHLIELDLSVEILPDFDLVDEVILCGTTMNEPIQATPVNITDLEDVDYKWYRNGNRLPFSGTVYYATQPGNYTVTVSNNDCEVSDTINIELIDFDVDLGDDPAYICGDGNTTITANIDTSNSATTINMSDIEYLWNTGETSKSIDVSQSGFYTVEVSYKQECTVIETVEVFVATLPEINPLSDFEKCSDESVDVTVKVNNIDAADLEYVWYRDGGEIAGETSATISVVQEGVYTVEINEIGSDFCYASEEFTADFYDNAGCVISQGMSPDSPDGLNDNLDLKFLSERTGIDNLKVYNRYGRLVFDEDNYVDSFIGQDMDGNKLETGTYYYVIELNSEDPVFGNSINGWVYINRDIN